MATLCFSCLDFVLGEPALPDLYWVKNVMLTFGTVFRYYINFYQYSEGIEVKYLSLLGLICWKCLFCVFSAKLSFLFTFSMTNNISSRRRERGSQTVMYFSSSSPYCSSTPHAPAISHFPPHYPQETQRERHHLCVCVWESEFKERLVKLGTYICRDIVVK